MSCVNTHCDIKDNCAHWAEDNGSVLGACDPAPTSELFDCYGGVECGEFRPLGCGGACTL